MEVDPSANEGGSGNIFGGLFGSGGGDAQ